MLSYPGLGAALGVLPPPHSLCSVPLMTTPPAGIMDATAVSRPTPHTAVSWFNPPIPAVPTVQWAPATASADVPSTSAPLLPGVSLSPATEPFPRKLVEKIQAGQFVEMKELLSDNIALLQQLDVFQGQCAMPVLPGALKPRFREVATLPSWLYSYLAYVALRSPDPATRDRLAYGRLLLREAQRHGGAGWLDYDRVFRQQAALDATLPWNAIHPAIQAATLTSRTAQPGLFCTLCREPDHTARDCALAYLERPPSHPATSLAQPPATQRQRPPPRRPDTICRSWNAGRCDFPRTCNYRHICSRCRLPHMARDCPRPREAKDDYRPPAPSSNAAPRT